MKQLYILIAGLLLSSPLCAQAPDSLWMKANQLYASGNYGEATTAYLKIVDEGKVSGDLYYNLGNAYFKQNMLGRSILSYERALRLSPSDEDIVHNLDFARIQVQDKIDVIPPFFLSKLVKSAQKMFTPDGWAVLAISLFSIALLLILGAYFLTAKLGLRRFYFWLGILLLALSVGSNMVAGSLSGKREAIILSPLATIKSSPDASGKEIFILHEGAKVRVIDQLNGWKRIKLDDNKQGWIPNESVEEI